jgi:hypothetical protein
MKLNELLLFMEELGVYFENQKQVWTQHNGKKKVKLSL